MIRILCVLFLTALMTACASVPHGTSPVSSTTPDVGRAPTEVPDTTSVVTESPDTMFMVLPSDSGLVRINCFPHAKAKDWCKKSHAMKMIQEYLNSHGYALHIDGVWGSESLSAIKSFQRVNGLGGDGVMGPATAKAMGMKLGLLAPWIQEINAGTKKHFGTFDKAKGVDKFCPKYASLSTEKKEMFWQDLIEAMTVRESSMNPLSTYMEPPPLNHNSLGLMQLSVASPETELCEVKKVADLYDPVNNLKCGMILMKKYISEKGQLTGGYKSSNAIGLSRYWSVMREYEKDGSTKRESFAYIQNRTKNFCAKL